MFTRAIVRPPASNFGEGLTTANLGQPDYQLALKQHQAYCAALERCGLTLTRLDPDPNYPDSTFVEDVAILTECCAILTRPGAPSRGGEVDSMRPIVAPFFPSLHEIVAPGTLDGGDVCQAGEHFFICVSERTNRAGSEQLAEILSLSGHSSTVVDIANNSSSASLLHLKSGVAYLGDHRLVITDPLSTRREFAGYDPIRVHADEEYAANCVRVNDYVLVASGHPRLENDLRELGYQIIALDMTEFQKMDGGLSCLSLRF